MAYTPIPTERVLKKGDRVKVRPSIEIDYDLGVCFVPDMEVFCGKEFIVASVCEADAEDSYYTDEDGKTCKHYYLLEPYGQENDIDEENVDGFMFQNYMLLQDGSSLSYFDQVMNVLKELEES